MKFQKYPYFFCAFLLIVSIGVSPVSGQSDDSDEDGWDLGLSDEDTALLKVLLGDSDEGEDDPGDTPDSTGTGTGDESEDEEIEWDESVEQVDELDVMSLLSGALSEDQEESSFFNLSEGSFMVGMNLGRRSNVLYSQDSLAEERPFWGAHAELLYWGLNYEGHTLTFYNLFEHVGYLGEGQADKEQLAISSFSYELPVYDEHKVYFDLGYLYQDQVFDVSSSEDNLFTIQAAGHRFSTGAGWKKKFGKNWTVTFGGNAERQLFAAPLDDYWQWGPDFLIQFKDNSRNRIRLKGKLENRDYDTRNETITGVPLQFKRFETEIEWQYDLTESGSWWTNLEIGYRRNEDNGGGFFDYHRYSIDPSIGYTEDNWDLEVGYSYKKYYYDLQFFGVDQVVRDDSIVYARLTRQIGDNWKWHAEWESQVAGSIDPADEYKVFSFMTGFDYELKW